mmetsp:Transcript_87171/g.186960  ORF Transcript_87171/g.186960 Transcript_87171/m.186960 type:complete len:212 (+) Transcript_87171:253-888(+)
MRLQSRQRTLPGPGCREIGQIRSHRSEHLRKLLIDLVERLLDSVSDLVHSELQGHVLTHHLLAVLGHLKVHLVPHLDYVVLHKHECGLHLLRLHLPQLVRELRVLDFAALIHIENIEDALEVILAHVHNLHQRREVGDVVVAILDLVQGDRSALIDIHLLAEDLQALHGLSLLLLALPRGRLQIICTGCRSSIYDHSGDQVQHPEEHCEDH